MTLWKIHSSFSLGSVISCLLKIHLSHLLFIQSLSHFLSKEGRYKNHESFSKCQAYVHCAQGAHYLNPAFWFSDWQYHFQGEWIYFLQFPRLIGTQKSKVIDIFYCFSWWKWEWKHRWQLFELPRGKNPIICRLPIQNKFWNILLKWHD